VWGILQFRGAETAGEGLVATESLPFGCGSAPNPPLAVSLRLFLFRKRKRHQAPFAEVNPLLKKPFSLRLFLLEKKEASIPLRRSQPSVDKTLFFAPLSFGKERGINRLSQKQTLCQATP